VSKNNIKRLDLTDYISHPPYLLSGLSAVELCDRKLHSLNSSGQDHLSTSQPWILCTINSNHF